MRRRTDDRPIARSVVALFSIMSTIVLNHENDRTQKREQVKPRGAESSLVAAVGPASRAGLEELAILAPCPLRLQAGSKSRTMPVHRVWIGSCCRRRGARVDAGCSPVRSRGVWAGWVR